MDPRRNTSIKWVPLPQEYCSLTRDVFDNHFKDKIEEAELIVEGRIYREELIVRLGFLRKNTIRQINFEASVDFNAEKDNAFELLNFLMDPLASMLEDFLSTKDVDFPPLWQSFKYKNKEIFLQYSAINSKLESEADRLLGANKGLVNDFDSDVEEDLAPLH